MITGDIPQPKIILEGTHLTNKTDIAFALAEHVEIIGTRKHRWHIPLISSEWETRCDCQPTKAAPGRSMIDFLEGDEPWMYSCYETYLRLLELNRDYYWVVDRFHISTIAFQRLMRSKEVHLAWVDRRLAALGFVLIHTWRRPDSFEAAREHRLTYSENPHRYGDLRLFVEEQALMTELIANSAMPSLTVDVSDQDASTAAAEIVGWLKRIGSFWRPTNACPPREGVAR